MAFVIMCAASNDIRDLLPLLPDTIAVLDMISAESPGPGTPYEIRPR